MQFNLKGIVAEQYGLQRENIFIGNGSDEIIDLLFRIFCDPGKDNAIVIEPSYGMYEVCASINNVEIKKSRLTEEFQLDLDSISSLSDDNTKLLFLCSPNNPTGNLLNDKDLQKVINSFNGIVVLDQAYIDFSENGSWAERITEYDNLVVMKTLSKAYGLAGIRIGMGFASKEIVKYFTNVKFPYNVSSVSQRLAIEALRNREFSQTRIRELVIMKQELIRELNNLEIVRNIFPSDANFLLVQFSEKTLVKKWLEDKGIIVRDRSNLPLCEDALRITIGTKQENEKSYQGVETD